MSFKNKLLCKNAYGLDVSGEVSEPSDFSGQDPRLDDTAEPQSGHETENSTQNTLHDGDAEQEFPQLRGRRTPNVFRGMGRE